jgi:hypothetical protein
VLSARYELTFFSLLSSVNSILLPRYSAYVDKVN